MFSTWFLFQNQDELEEITPFVTKNKKIFCKGGAEGVFLFVSLSKKIIGVIKVVDGNERAIPSVIFNLSKKYNLPLIYDAAPAIGVKINGEKIFTMLWLAHLLWKNSINIALLWKVTLLNALYLLNYSIKKEVFKMKFIQIIKNVETVILGSKKPKDHWKKYRKEKY